jgi:phage/plasmid-like protein (TIGR03299 family)
MSAGLTSTDQMFSVREMPWHGMGKIFQDYPSRAEAQEAAHPWEPETEPLYRIVLNEQVCGTCGGGLVRTNGHWEVNGSSWCKDESSHMPKRKIVKVEEFSLVKRSDTQEPLDVKPDSRSLVTNTEMWDIAEALEGSSGDVMYETAGSLFGGRKVWIALRFKEPLVIDPKNDKTTTEIPYGALQNDNAGGGAFRLDATSVRVCCANTSRMADLDAKAKGTQFVFRHTKNISDRIDEAREALVGWRESVLNYQRLMRVLLDTPIDRSQRTEFVHQFIPMPQENLISARVRTNVIQARNQMFGILDGPTSEGTEGTAYWLYNAATEYAQWYRKARSPETRFKRSFLDKDRMTTDAFNLAMEVAK